MPMDKLPEYRALIHALARALSATKALSDVIDHVPDQYAQDLVPHGEELAEALTAANMAVGALVNLEVVERPVDADPRDPKIRLLRDEGDIDRLMTQYPDPTPTLTKIRHEEVHVYTVHDLTWACACGRIHQPDRPAPDEERNYSCDCTNEFLLTHTGVYTS